MEILKTATEWAKDEVFSSKFFILFGVLFILATLGFWQLGKTVISKAFIIPTLVAGILLLALGLGLYFTNKSRITNFTTAYNADANVFVQSEITRAEKSLSEYHTTVFKIIPLIIVVFALLIIFIDKPVWRAISTTVIAMMVVILLVDNNANARLEAYHKQLLLAKE